MKVYDAIAQALLAEHDGPIFGLMGDGNMSLWGALGRTVPERLLSSRNEAGASDRTPCRNSQQSSEKRIVTGVRGTSVPFRRRRTHPPVFDDQQLVERVRPLHCLRAPA